MGHAQKPSAKAVGDPNIAAAVNGKAAIVNSGLEILGLARIRRGEARNVVHSAVGHPNPVLLVDAKVKWRPERLARFDAVSLANDAALGQIALWEVDELALSMPRTQTSPLGVTMTPCINPSLPSKLMPLGGVNGLPFLSNTVMDLVP